MWQHIQLCEQTRPWVTLACCRDVKRPTNKQNTWSLAVLAFFCVACRESISLPKDCYRIISQALSRRAYPLCTPHRFVMPPCLCVTMSVTVHIYHLFDNTRVSNITESIYHVVNMSPFHFIERTCFVSPSLYVTVSICLLFVPVRVLYVYVSVYHLVYMSSCLFHYEF